MGDRTVYVGNVDAEVDEATLRAVFENCGYVTQVRIAGKKNYNTVYCFVEFAEISQAALALAMDGLQLGDRQIKVSMSKITPRDQELQREKPRIPPMNLLQAQAQARLLSMQPAFNLLPFHQSLGLAQPLLAAAAAAPAQPKPARRPHQDPDKVCRTIYVENVAEDITEQIMADHFGVCGEVTAVRVSGTGPGLKKAWVEFGHSSQARAAREYDSTGLGSEIIRVRPSKTAIHTNGLVDPQQRSPGYDGSHVPPGYSRHRPTIPLRRDPEDHASLADRRRHTPHTSPDFRAFSEPSLHDQHPHPPDVLPQSRPRDQRDYDPRDYNARDYEAGFRDGKRMRT